MINERTNENIEDMEVLIQPELYVYILLNDSGKVKVGITHNIQQRLKSLSGSNSQGNKIIRAYLSPNTYLRCIEGIMHNRMGKYRIPNTEWFYYPEDETGIILYDSAIELLNKLIYSKNYERLNQLHKENKDKLK